MSETNSKERVAKNPRKESDSKPLVVWRTMTDEEIERRMKQLIERKFGGLDETSVRNNITIDRKKLEVSGERAEQVAQGIGILLLHAIVAEKRIQHIDFGGNVVTSGTGGNEYKGELISIFRKDQGGTMQDYSLVMAAAYDVVKTGVKLTSGIEIPSYREA